MLFGEAKLQRRVREPVPRPVHLQGTADRRLGEQPAETHPFPPLGPEHQFGQLHQRVPAAEQPEEQPGPQHQRHHRAEPPPEAAATERRAEQSHRGGAQHPGQAVPSRAAPVRAVGRPGRPEGQNLPGAEHHRRERPYHHEKERQPAQLTARRPARHERPRRLGLREAGPAGPTVMLGMLGPGHEDEEERDPRQGGRQRIHDGGQAGRGRQHRARHHPAPGPRQSGVMSG